MWSGGAYCSASNAGLVLGVECLRSLKGIRFALATVRGIGETFGLLLFFGPILIGVGIQYFTVSTHAVTTRT